MRIFWGLLLAIAVCTLLLANPGPARIASVMSPRDVTPTNPDTAEPTTDTVSSTLYAQATIILATITAQAQGSMPPQPPLSTRQLQASQTALHATQTAFQAVLPQLRLTQTAQEATARLSCAPVAMPLHPAQIGALNLSPSLLKKRIIYTDRGPYCNKLFVLYSSNSDGSNQIALTSGANDVDYPIWSPDGQRIAFVHDGDAIYTMSPDGTNQAPVISIDPRSGFMYAPVWSPDSKYIAYTRADRSLPPKLTTAITNLDGSRQFDLPDTGGLVYHVVSWSPDSKSFAFTYSPAQGIYEIHVMNTDGSHEVKLADGQDPDWSPDGKLIAYVSNTWPNGVLRSSIMTIVPDGTGAKEVFVGKTDQSVYGPSWSPHSKYVAFGVDNLKPQTRYGNLDIYVVGRDGSRPTNLTPGNYDSGMGVQKINPSWSSDEADIAYEVDANDTFQINIVNVTNAKSVPLIKEGKSPGWQP